MDATVTFLVNWIGSQLIDEASLLSGVEEQVRSLQDELKSMQRYIRDVEDKQGEDGGNGQVAIFIAKIREAAFRAEDVIDIYILKIGSKSTFSKFACFLCNSRDMHRIGKNIIAIQKDIKEASERLIRYGSPREASSLQDQMRHRGNILESYPHIEEEFVVGLDTAIQNLVYQITSHIESTWVVSIVGQGGIGKTTLARKIYNHSDVTSHFNVKAWVSISQQWNKKEILLEILRQTGGIRDDERNSMLNRSDREIIEMTYNFLKEKQYLVVLDDTWEKNAWNDVSSALPRNKKSKIIITTRIYDVPSYADPNCIIYEPPLLTEEQGWELFSKLVSMDEVTRFKDLGKEMIQKCGGLPLAIVILAGLLRTKKGLNEWMLVNTTFNSKLRQVVCPSPYGISIDQMFQLSYHDLPHYLRPCFLYLAIFPEDYEILTEMLIQMWIAEGFITVDYQLQEEEILEDVAEQFLEELICRCLVQVVKRSYTGKVERCRLHDLTRDFCIVKAKEQQFTEIFNPSNSKGSSISKHSRRVVINSSSFDPILYSSSRSLSRLEYHMDLTVDLQSLCKKMELLRVLNLWNVKIADGTLPKEIGNLIFLRYLGLINTNITSLPKSIGNLRNLLTLDCRKYFISGKVIMEVPVRSLEVPDVLWEMEHLRHLYLPTYAKSTKNLRLDTLTMLQTFWGLAVETHMTNELRGLAPSLRKLQLDNIVTKEQLGALFESPCIRSGHLQILYLSWEFIELESLERLHKHCKQLQELHLIGPIREGPSPILFPCSIIVLELRCNALELQSSIAAMGELNYLKVLRLGFKAYVGNRMVFDANMFPSLEKLSLASLYGLNEWRVDTGAVPRLKKLKITNCHGLKRLPQGLKYVTTLQKLTVYDMTETFCMRLQQLNEVTGVAAAADDHSGSQVGEDFHIISHIPSVEIRPHRL